MRLDAHLLREIRIAAVQAEIFKGTDCQEEPFAQPMHGLAGRKPDELSQGLSGSQNIRNPQFLTGSNREIMPVWASTIFTRTKLEDAIFRNEPRDEPVCLEQFAEFDRLSPAWQFLRFPVKPFQHFFQRRAFHQFKLSGQRKAGW